MPRTLDPSVAVVIPARYESSRFPGKPLAMIAGTSLLQRTWQRACLAVDASSVHIATDDHRIFEHVDAFGGQAVMTSSKHMTGTDRCAEVADRLGAELIVNVQGDEPLIEPQTIHAVLDASDARPGDVINAMTVIEDEADFRSPSVPKVVAAADGRLLYMSRSAIPTDKRHGFVGEAHRQVCVYAFPSSALETFVSPANKTPLEAVEDIEILRFLERGVRVQMVEVSTASIAVDHPEDIARVEAMLGA